MNPSYVFFFFNCFPLVKSSDWLGIHDFIRFGSFFRQICHRGLLWRGKEIGKIGPDCKRDCNYFSCFEQGKSSYIICFIHNSQTGGQGWGRLETGKTVSYY